MKIEEIKTEISQIHTKWLKLSDSYDDDKYAELYESYVRSFLISYCERKHYKVEGYPTQKRALGKTDGNYDDDYFCYERNLKYLETLATIHTDVFELMYFYSKTFWPDQIGSKERYLKYLLNNVDTNCYEIEF